MNVQYLVIWVQKNLFHQKSEGNFIKVEDESKPKWQNCESSNDDNISIKIESKHIPIKIIISWWHRGCNEINES